MEEIGRYLRRDCLEIADIKATSECPAEAIVESVAKAIGVLVNKEDISIAHPIPSYNTAAQPKIIVKFTRRSLRNTFIQTGKSWPAREQVTFRTLILNPMQMSTSLTSYKKKLFGDVNKEKKRLKWKFIWTYNGRIFIRNTEDSPAVAFDTADDLAKFQSDHPPTH